MYLCIEFNLIFFNLRRVQFINPKKLRCNLMRKVPANLFPKIVYVIITNTVPNKFKCSKEVDSLYILFMRYI